jgi:hypothetical protein
MCSSYLPLGVPNWTVLFIINTVPSVVASWAGRPLPAARMPGQMRADWQEGGSAGETPSQERCRPIGGGAAGRGPAGTMDRKGALQGRPGRGELRADRGWASCGSARGASCRPGGGGRARGRPERVQREARASRAAHGRASRAAGGESLQAERRRRGRASRAVARARERRPAQASRAAARASRGGARRHGQARGGKNGSRAGDLGFHTIFFAMCCKQNTRQRTRGLPCAASKSHGKDRIEKI